MIKVVVVEDDLDLLDELAFNLRDEGLVVATCSDGRALDKLLASESFDVVVLDLGLPHEGGNSIARRLSRERPGLGIVMLTARTAARDRILGMEDGADVYLCKPAELRELTLVIRALVRRLGAGRAEQDSLILLTRENLLLMPTGNSVELTPSETIVLSRLARSTSRQVSRRQIIEAFGSSYMDYDERRLEAIVSRLRKKLEAAGLPSNTLQAVRGLGYALQVELHERQGRKPGDS